ncbi:hypothetical protein KFQ04_08710 [Pseudomonas synxantha]|nr:hypothetical protein KFQ04_08710 [Pseudomonas synxantha]
MGRRLDHLLPWRLHLPAEHLQECPQRRDQPAPGAPKYRGLGSQHYAIYYNDETYGSTCHHLAPSVDSGQIIDVARFNVAPAETASSLRLHVGAYCLQQFIHLLTDYILQGRPLPVSPENWGERLYKQSELKPWMEKIRAQEPDHRCFK